MKRLNVIAAMIIMATSCNNGKESTVLDLNSQEIGIVSVHNARQLGGYKIGNRTIRKDLLLRTARLSALSAEDSLVLADTYKVQCVYDFRGQDEAVTAPDVIPGNSRYLQLSLSLAGKSSQSDYKVKSENDMVQMLLGNADNPLIQDMCERMYDKIFFDEVSQEVYRRFFADLVSLDPADGAVLWHCTQGKDRAGCASAMVLAALGAERELIVADFTLSKVYYDPFLANIPTETENQSKVITTLLSANPEVFESTLDRIDERYGSLRNYLAECLEVTPEMIEILRERYLE